MNRVSKTILGSVAALAVAGAAFAAGERVHRLDVALPGGGIAHVDYTGDVAPKVTVAPADTSAFAPIGWFDAAPFAAFDRIAADMDRQIAMMTMQANSLATLPRVDQASLAKLPPGTMHYSFVSTTSGSGTCSRSVEMTSTGDGKAPQVIQRVSGDCDATKPANRTPTLAAEHRAPAPLPHTKTTV